MHIAFTFFTVFQLTHLLRGATCPNVNLDGYAKFQLTHLLRGATSGPNDYEQEYNNFNSRTSCEVRLCLAANFMRRVISTHAPLARCDIGFSNVPSPRLQFQLTHLLRGATFLMHYAQRLEGFQLTHLLRGATASVVLHLLAQYDFNSRTSCEVRQETCIISPSLDISTHAPLARCDRFRAHISPPRLHISTHAPLARCDAITRKINTVDKISTHAPLARCDGVPPHMCMDMDHFNSRTSCEVRLHSDF